ncbi:release factor glutamine methyltransferase [Anaerotaenia torta]|uniref:peptide chain release factor N(5)-glutamine methyltransferase n=1 Tax=Anaerotaenia torta TaxID=433293 RepID=UPI003D1CAC50
MSTYKQLLQTGRELLKQQGIADADVDAWYLLAHVCGINRTDLLLRGDTSVEQPLEDRYLELARQRERHIPLQHITGVQEFMGLEFEVNGNVLVPRQDTEVLTEEVLKVCKDRSILDMCTGSGCIIISLAKLGSPKLAVGADLSEEALAVAARNIKRHGAEVKLVQSNLFEKIAESPGLPVTYDILVSNPPYIPSGEIRELMPEVRDHEPRMALDGGGDGLLFYRRISEAAKRHLNREGYLFYEIGYDQGEAVRQILQREGFADIEIKKDLSGLDRVVSARRW